MKHSFIFFLIILVLGFILGFYYNGALYEKIRYEKDMYRNMLKDHPSILSPVDEIDYFMYNGIYGWFCDDTSTYYPSVSDKSQEFLNRGCNLTGISLSRNPDSNVNRDSYIKNGWFVDGKK